MGRRGKRHEIDDMIRLLVALARRPNEKARAILRAGLFTTYG